MCYIAIRKLTPKEELIETLWNVNPKANPMIAASTRINRNIVECKFYLRDLLLPQLLELIETLWNVNYCP